MCGYKTYCSIILSYSNVIITDPCVIILDFNIISYERLTNIRIGRISVLLIYIYWYNEGIYEWMGYRPKLYNTRW